MGHISIDRKIFSHPLWKENRPRTKFEAWLDLIQLVSFKDKNKAIINNTVVKWNRGQYPISYAFLSNRWLWSVKRVRTYLQLLKDEKQIETNSIGQITILSLINYELYNKPIECGGARGTVQKGAQLGAQSGAQINNSSTDNCSNEGQAQGQDEGQAKGKLGAGIKEDKEDKESNNKNPQSPTSVAPKIDFIDRIIREFSDSYQKRYNLSYVVVAKGKERNAAGQLAKIYRNKYPEAKTEEVLAALKTYFGHVMRIDDAFIQNTMSLPMVMNKFNDINKILKNGKYREQNSKGATPEQLFSLVAEDAADRA